MYLMYKNTLSLLSLNKKSAFCLYVDIRKRAGMSITTSTPKTLEFILYDSAYSAIFHQIGYVQMSSAA